MKKSDAIEALGGTVLLAAEAVGVTPSAISQWPDELPSRLVDRVQAALWRKHQQDNEPEQDTHKTGADAGKRRHAAAADGEGPFTPLAISDHGRHIRPDRDGPNRARED